MNLGKSKRVPVGDVRGAEEKACWFRCKVFIDICLLWAYGLCLLSGLDLCGMHY